MLFVNGTIFLYLISKKTLANLYGYVKNALKVAMVRLCNFTRRQAEEQKLVRSGAVKSRGLRRFNRKNKGYINMTLPTFTLRQMVEAGVHFGHHARRWNPQMAPYIYGKKDNIHIIDLQKTYPMLYNALNAVRDVAANGGKVLFVATKRQAQDIVKESAGRCGQFYVNYRWLGGMLTNWKTVYKSISRLNKLNEMEANNAYEGYTKKEVMNLKKEREKLAITLDGIKDMGGQPDMLFVIDTPKEALAIKEAKKLGIPVVGIIDTNANPNEVEFPVPGNDDAIRAIQFYCDLVSDAVLDGVQAEMEAKGLEVSDAETVETEEKAAPKKRASRKKAESAAE